jgi:hypothetical protein
MIGQLGQWVSRLTKSGNPAITSLAGSLVARRFSCTPALRLSSSLFFQSALGGICLYIELQVADAFCEAKCWIGKLPLEDELASFSRNGNGFAKRAKRSHDRALESANRSDHCTKTVPKPDLKGPKGVVL